jgi:PAS domain S-box-containing protein
MMPYITTYWNAALRTGLQPSMDYTKQMRLLALNAFLLISIALTMLFIVVFVLLGSYSALQGLSIIPLLLVIFYLNYKGRYKLASFLVVYALLVLVTVLALLDRRTGTEFILIAIGCSSVMVFDRLRTIIISFLSAFICYSFYIWYDISYAFVPDPTVPYILVQNSLMFVSGFAVIAQSLAFRSLIHQYAQRLKLANQETKTVNEELKASNEELTSLADQLDWIVKQKSTELQSYQDAININIYSALTNLNGDILKVNDPLATISGYTVEELVGQNFRILNSGYHSPQFFKNLHDTIRAGKSWRGEVKNKSKNGTAFWIDMVIMPIKNEKDSTIYFLTLALPITDRKEAQEKQEQTAKMLESIAFRTSHKVRGPLARIMGLTKLLENDAVHETELRYVSQKIVQSSKELDNATHDLTAFVNEYTSSFLNE